MATIAALYSPLASFTSHPFRAHQDPAEYAAWAFAEQEAAECRFAAPLVDGRRAAVEWWAVVTGRDGAVATLAGTSLLTFDAGGLVTEQRDVWTSAAGRSELPEWAPGP